MTSPPGPLPCEGRGRRMAPSATAGHVGAALAAAPCFSILRGSSLWCNWVAEQRMGKTTEVSVSSAKRERQVISLVTKNRNQSFCGSRPSVPGRNKSDHWLWLSVASPLLGFGKVLECVTTQITGYVSIIADKALINTEAGRNQERTRHLKHPAQLRCAPLC